MPRNGNGVFTILTPIEIGALRSSAVANADFEDVGDELTNSVPLDGSAEMTGVFRATEGDASSPGISFSVDSNSGFALTGANEMAWAAGASARAVMDANGKLSLLNGLSVTGSVNLSSSLRPQNLFAVGERLIQVRRTENDASEHALVQYQSGDGSGAAGELRVIGSASNNVSAVRYYVNSVKAFGFSQTLFAIEADLQVGSAGVGPRIDASGHLDNAELTAAPSAPSANIARVYARDNGSGRTELYWKDSANAESLIGNGAVDYQVFTSSGTWTKPSRGTMAMIEVWGAGGSGGLGEGSQAGAGGAGGAYTRKTIALSSLSAAVSVTIGSGGAAQTTPSTSGFGGGSSAFGAYCAAYGGAGGYNVSDRPSAGAGGGGLQSAGSQGNHNSTASANGGAGGLPLGALGSIFWGNTPGTGRGRGNPFGGGSGAGSSVSFGAPASAGGDSLFGGGGSASGGWAVFSAEDGASGGGSVFGGGAGGSSGALSSGSGASGGAGGASVLGGAGGAGGDVAAFGVSGSTNGGNGSVPAGGGGGAGGNPAAASSGAGARGEVRITVW